MCCNWLNVGGDHIERNVDSLCELRPMPHWQLARKQEPPSCNHRTWILPTPRVSLNLDFPQEPPDSDSTWLTP